MSTQQSLPDKLEPIAVVAIGSIFPGRGDTTGFWRDIVEGVDTFTSVPGTHWLIDDYYDSDKSARDCTYGSRGAFVPATSFDPLSFGIPPNSLSTTDTAQLLALVAARHVLDDIERETNGPLDKSRASVILGVAATTELVGQMMGRLQRPSWIKGMREAGLDETLVQSIADRISSNFVEWRETTFPGLLGNVVAGRIANRLDFGGSNYVTDAACASSLSAMQIALHELHAGDSDLVLTGGVDALNDIFMYMCFSKTPALSPTGDCRPLSADADGTMLGEGVGMLALRRLSDAERDGNRIHAIIKGLGGGSDGRSTAVYAPLASGQARTLTRAYEKAGYSPRTVELVEAHGTGTVAGDKTELEALHEVFSPEGDVDSPWCALGSVKSQIGHTKAAAGAAGLLKVIGGLSRKVLPPTIKVRQPAEALCQNTPFYLGTKARPWIRGVAHPRRASVSSFGFGGSNFHVTLEEYTGNNAVQPIRVLPAELLLVSAATKPELCQQIEALVRDVVHEDDLARVASQSWKRFDREHVHRAAVVAETQQHLNKLCAKLLLLVEKGADSTAPLNKHIYYRTGKVEPGKLALLFSGQGSQYLGMGADIAMVFPQARAVWDAACDIPATADLKLHDLAFPPTLFTEESHSAANSRLTDMRHAQPAIAAVELSQLTLLNQLGVSADMQAGHSFGEVMALCSAGVFDAATALNIACDRANAMSKAAASTDGSMLAVQASAAAVSDMLAGSIDSITLANDNAPEQVVLSGEASRLEQAARLLNAQGINSQILPVAAAFHSPQVDQAIQPFAKLLSSYSLGQPAEKVYANSTASPYPTDKASLVKVLSEQIGKPVLFRQTLNAMYDAGATIFIEVGPGSVLTNLVRKSLPAKKVTAIALDDKHSDGVTSLLCAVGQLATSGVAVDLDNLFEGLPAPLERAKPSKHAVELLGSNYQKPYPPQGDAATSPAGKSIKPSPTATSTADTQATPKAQTNGAVQSVPVAEKARCAKTRPGADITPMGQPNQKQDPTQTVPTPTTVGVYSHQPKAAATLTMAFQDHSSASSETAQHSQPQSVTKKSGHNGIVAENSAPSGHAVDMAQSALFNELSARHAQYLATVGSAHQAYLQLAAALVDGVKGTALSISAEPAVHSNHGEPILNGNRPSQSAAYAATTSLNGHAHLNGASHSAQQDSRTVASSAGTYAMPAPTAPIENATPSDIARANGSVESLSIESGSTITAASLLNDEPVVTPASTNGSAATTGSSPRISADIVRALIAEKTGYPEEMIEDDMDLSGELGIDSIKQVEVLSALRVQVPEIKDVGTADIGQLRTIRQIADFFG